MNNAYDPGKDRIELRYKNGTLRDIAEASDNWGDTGVGATCGEVVLGVAEVVGLVIGLGKLWARLR